MITVATRRRDLAGLCPLCAALLLAVAACAGGEGESSSSSATETAGESATESKSESESETESETESESGEPQVSTDYYWGTSTVLSPDESVVYMTNNVLMKRVVDPVAATILEDVYQNNNFSDPTAVFHYPALLRRVAGETHVFALEDPSGVSTGTLTYEGEPWAWTGWTYDLTFTALVSPPTEPGSRLIGSASTTPEGGFTTRKEIQTPEGVVTVVLVEEVAAIDAALFDERKEGPWAPGG